MADIFISYSREDRDRVRPIVEGLQQQGWDVWWDPSIPLRGQNDDMDRMLGSAGAVLVIWSASSRGSEYVRSEAAAGLYKNKLIQARIDTSAPPRPFDQVDVTDLGAWSGDNEDAGWQRVLAAVRLYAGAPGASRPQVMRGPSSPRAGGRIGYLEPKRSIAPAPVFAGIALVIAAGSVWLVDPLGWRGAKPQAANASQPPKIVAPATPVVASAPLSAAELAAADVAWDRVDRTNIVALRKFLVEYGAGPQSESARSQLRVMDAQAWRDAVSIDTEAAYQAYLVTYPAEGVAPGAMNAAAHERLVSLKVERSQALTDIQRGLQSMGLYAGPLDGVATPAVTKAVKAFAARRKSVAPDVATAAPRDLRSFGDLVSSEQVSATLVAAAAPATVAAVKAPAATAVPTTVAPPAVKPSTAPAAVAPSAASLAAAEADRLRIQQAEALRTAAASDAETLAKTEIERVERAAWEAASKANTVESYRSYLGVQSGGQHAADARARLAALTRPPAFAVSQLTPELRTAVEAARSAEGAAKTRAANARAIAAQADAAAARAREGAAGTQTLLAADGDRFETEVANGAPNGLGVKISGDGTSNGDRYRGELRNGHGNGLGVYEFSDNANNSAANALRYEGEHAADLTQGLGVTYWKNGDTFAGEETGNRNAGRGVQTFANGQRYDGEVADGARNGFGVVWSKEGQILYAGKWKNGELVEPMAVGDAAAAPAAASSGN
jgi:hypothetical protein